MTAPTPDSLSDLGFDLGDAPASAQSAPPASELGFDLGPVPAIPAPPAGPPAEPPSAPVYAFTPEPPRGGGRSLTKPLAVAALAVVLVAAGAFAAVNLLGSKQAGLEAWAPAGTAMWLDVRADAPGDQTAKLGAILGKFPAFAKVDGAGARIDTALDDILGASTSTGATGAAGATTSWTKDIKPWATGEVGIAINVSTFAATTGASAVGAQPSKVATRDGVVAIVALKDASGAKAWATKDLGSNATTITYAGGDLMTNAAGDMSFAIRGNALIAGSEAAVKAALDTKGASAVATSTTFTEARATAPETGYLGFMYVDAAAFNSAIMKAAAPSGEPLTCASPAPGASSAGASGSAWLAGSFYATDDSLVFAADAKLAGTSTLKNSTSGSAAHLPANTVAAVEVRDLGPGLVAGVDTLETQLGCLPQYASTVTQLKQTLDALGGAQALIGWAGDTSLAATASGGTYGAGLVSVVADQAAATKAATQLSSLLAMGGMKATSAPYGAGTLTLFELPAGTAGAAPVELAMTAQGGIFALGTADFVKAAVDATPTSSLASAAAYKRAVAAAGGDGLFDAYLDIAGVRAAAEALLTGDAKAQYEANAKANLTPLESFALVARTTGSMAESRMVLTFVH